MIFMMCRPDLGREHANRTTRARRQAGVTEGYFAPQGLEVNARNYSVAALAIPLSVI